MSRQSILIAVTAAALLPIAGIAQADHRTSRGGGLFQTLLPELFRHGGAPRLRIEVGRSRPRGDFIVVMPMAPFDDEIFFEDESFISPETGNFPLLARDAARGALLDRDLGEALDQLRRDLALREQSQPLPLERHVAPTRPLDDIEVSRLPDNDTPALSARVTGRHITEETVLGRIDLLGQDAAATAASPEKNVGTANAGDVAANGPDAFAPVTDPAAQGLPDLADGSAYYTLHGSVVTLDAPAQQALLVAALSRALDG